MLKTVDHDEFYFLKKILPDYYQHLKLNKDTLITRFYGMHKIKYQEKGSVQRLYFVIMANVFNTGRTINKRFDLKGSTHGRLTAVDAENPSVALKDLNFV